MSNNDKAHYESYASLLIMERNTSIGNVLMRTLSQTAFLTFSDPLLESANLRKIHNGAEIFIENRLDTLLRPIVGINHGRNVPVIKSNDKNDRVIAAKTNSLRENGYTFLPVLLLFENIFLLMSLKFLQHNPLTWPLIWAKLRN